MTLHDIGVFPGDSAEAGAAAVDGLYPTLNDPNFNTKIALRKEFFDTKMDVDNTKSVEEEAEILCNAQIELAPNQQFVRNFLSVETPYNSLLLYHGLGTGKTCSAISVAEEMRDYMKQMGINQQIIVIASPNVQENFRLQLFDERELREIEPGVWNIRACTGNNFIKEINPMNMKGLTRDKIVKQIRRLISSHYSFLDIMNSRIMRGHTHQVWGFRRMRQLYKRSGAKERGQRRRLRRLRRKAVNQPQNLPK